MRGRCIWRVHSARSQPWVCIGGFPEGNPATPDYRLSYLTFQSAYSNAQCVHICGFHTLPAVTRDPEFDPTRFPCPGDPTSIPCPLPVGFGLRPARLVRPGAAANWVRRTRRVVEARRVYHSPVSPAQLRPVYRKCGHHDQGGSPVISRSPPTGVDRLRCLIFSLGLAAEPA